MSDIKTWSTTAASNNAASPNGFAEGALPSTINNSARELMAAVRRQYEEGEWVDLGNTIAYASSTTFTVSGDVRSQYSVNRRIRATDSSTLYGLITANSFSSPNTTVTVSLDSGNLSSNLSAISLNIIAGNSGSGVLYKTGGEMSGPLTTTSTIDGVDLAGLAATAVLKNAATGAASMPSGTTSQRPTGAVGMFRHNATLDQFEGYNDGAWGEIGGGGPSLGTDSVIRTNAKVIAENITFAGNENGMSVGPITVNNSYTVTVASGSTWVIL